MQSNRPASLSQQKQEFQEALRNQPVISKEKPIQHNVSNVATGMDFHSVGGIRHLNSYLHALLTCLKRSDRPRTVSELEQLTNITLSEMPQLVNLLLHHDHVRKVLTCTESGSGTKTFALEYHAQFRVKNKEEMLQVLKELPKYHGVPLDVFREHSNIVNNAAGSDHIEAMLNDLEESKHVLVVSFKEGSNLRRILFFNWHRDEYNKFAQKEQFSDIWQQIVPPGDDRDLEQELEKFGLKPLRTETDRVAALRAKQPLNSSGRKKPRQSASSSKRLRLTNVHLLDVGIDLHALMTDNKPQS
jgi:hypothetical protein